MAKDESLTAEQQVMLKEHYDPSLDGVHPDCKTVKQALEWRNGTEETPEVLT
tara:strand:+ start:2488 stop:2643 length:156 start_codon:yes stop_codon:yes gene_type:complete